MKAVVEDSNEKHLAPWSEACTNDNIINTPLSPYLDKVSPYLDEVSYHLFFLTPCTVSA